MNIGIDARMISHSGIGVILENVIRRLPPGRDEYVLYGDPVKLQGFDLPIVPADFPIYSLKEQLLLPGLLKRSKTDLFYCPHYTAPLLASQKIISTVNDIIHLLFPEYLPAFGSSYARFMMKFSCMKSSHVIAISRHTAEDIEKHLGVKADKIRIIYPGVNDLFKPYPIEPEIRERYGSYILYVGNIRPHKNLHRLIEAFIRFKRTRKSAHKLIAIGKGKEPYLTRIKQQISESGMERDIVILNNVTLSELPRFYSNADLFVFPSLYEGFGLPPLEAMACGCPVVSANTSSLPEVVGEAAVMIDPYNVEALADAIDSVFFDETAKKLMIEKGLIRAKQFTWEKTVLGYLNVFQEAAR